MVNYTLVLDNLLDNRGSKIGLEEMRGVIIMVVEGKLVENSPYSFHIVVTNKVGEAQSTTVQIGKRKYLLITIISNVVYCMQLLVRCRQWSSQDRMAPTPSSVST